MNFSLFRKKPRSLGEGLKRIKRLLGGYGKNQSEELGKRIYKTPSRNKVYITSDYNKLTIKKILNIANTFFYKRYIGKRALIERNYKNTPINKSKELFINRSTWFFDFAPLKQQYINQPSFQQDFKKVFGLPAKDTKITPRVKYEYKCDHRNIPYDKAISMGFKI